MTPRTRYSPGARSLDDPILPQIGNGGYDARHYSIALDYDPVANSLLSASTTISAIATQNLSELSFDFQKLDVSAVTVNGVPATFSQVDATPQLSSDPDVTQPMKLIVTPAAPLNSGDPFTVVVSYSGTPVRITDADHSFEGWIPACYGAGQTPPCDGGLVLGEPLGSEAWFPSNDYPSDKATFDTTITVPTAYTAFGIGELASRVVNGDGTWTWNWSENEPAATYLATATVGLFDYSLTAMIETSTNRALAVYDGIDSSYGSTAKANVAASLADTPAMLNFLSGLYGPYPFDSIGGVVDRVADVGYALEVQTKPTFDLIESGSQDIDSLTQLHEIAHQWFGDAVTLARWNDLWFNEGWATWSEWDWDFEQNGAPSPAERFDDIYANAPDSDWQIAPAVLDGDPAKLFSEFPNYERGAMVVEATRQILGDEGFDQLIHALISGHRYGNITTEQFIALAEQTSGFTGSTLEQLHQFYEQWLFGETKPTIVPADFP